MSQEAIEKHEADERPMSGDVTDALTRQSQTPEDTAGTKLGSKSKAAAGIPAIVETIKFGLGEMGAVRTARTYLSVNQKEGFDCQSCAWPSPDVDRSVFEFCESGAKAIAAEATTKRVTTTFFERWSVAELTEQSDYWLNQQGRLTHPAVLRRGATRYETINWDDAFELIAAELNALDSPNEAVFYTSGRTSNEAAFLYQLFARQFGTNNLPDCSNMCHESSGAALTETLGVGKGTVKLADFEVCDAIFILGQNPGTNHPRMLTALEHAKRRGAKIVAINPLAEVGLMRVKNPNPQEYSNPLKLPLALLGEGTALADLHLPIRINGDVAALKGIMKEMLAAEESRPGSVFDHDFIREHTAGFDEFVADLKATDWNSIVENSGLTREQIGRAADIAVNSKRTICCWAMGLTQHKNAVGTIQEMVNFLLVGGHIGREGAGTCCVRGHSNVQGDRTMGIWERMPQTFLDALGREFDFTPPSAHGLDTVNSIKAMHAGRVKVFLAMGGNFLSATPDTAYTAQALKRCRLTVHVSTKLNRAHLITGEQALILPCLGRTEIDRQANGEQFVTVEDSMGVISSSRGKLSPASAHLLSEPAIVARLAQATLGPKSTVDWTAMAASYDSIRDRVARVVPGFENYNERIRRDVFYLPNAARELEFRTAPGKAVFTVHPIPEHKLEPGRLLMMTIRSHDQFNTTIYGLDDRYRGVYGGRRVIFLNSADIAARALIAGQLVDIHSHFEDERRTAKHFIVVPFEIPQGCAATYYPETNVLVPIGSVAERSNTPTFKSIVISVEASVDWLGAQASRLP